MAFLWIPIFVVRVDLGGIVGLPVHPVGVGEGLAAGVDEGALPVQVVGPQPVGGQAPRHAVSWGWYLSIYEFWIIAGKKSLSLSS